MRLPFVFFALWLGGGPVSGSSKRLFGPEGGAFALALYIFCPAVIRFATRTPTTRSSPCGGSTALSTPAWASHMRCRSPRYKWKTPALSSSPSRSASTAAAHLLAAMVGLLAGTPSSSSTWPSAAGAYVSQILIYACLGAMFIELASFSFRPSAFLYIFIGGAGRFWFSLAIARHALFTMSNAGILVAAAVALIMYASSRRSRYFGNTAPLLMLLGSAAALHDAGFQRAVVLGAATSLYLHRGRLRGRPATGRPLVPRSQSIHSAHRWRRADPGSSLLGDYRRSTQLIQTTHQL